MPWGLFILLGVGLALGWALLVAYTTWLLTHPPRRTYAFAVARNLPGDPSELSVIDAAGAVRRGLPYTEWTLRSRGRDLPVWDVPGLDPAGPTIIITGGWGDSRIVMLPRLAAVAPMASRVILWDLPAHGDAPKGGFTLGLREHEDLIALIERLQPGGPLVLMGSSLGAGVVIVAAAELARAGASPISAVIAEAPYRVPMDPARNVLALRGMPHRSNLRPAMAIVGLRLGQGLAWALSATAGGFDRALHAARLPASMPLLVLHGSEDDVCPIADSRAIAGAAPHARLVVIDGGGHNNLWTDAALAPRCSEAVRTFISSVSPVPATPTTT